MEEESTALENMNCWDVDPLPQNEHVLHSTFVLERRKDESGNLKCHKARFVVCGNEGNENE